MKISISYYTARNSRISEYEKTVNIAVNAVLTENNKNNNHMLQSGYTAQNSRFTRIGLQYIQG